jgi:DNA polymerase-3 subunit delta
MKVKPSEADRTARHPPRGLVAALIFGPDSGLIRERAETLLKTVVDDLGDPFRVADLDEQTLAGDPARLFDEAASISMLGGRRVVRVRGASNALAELFESFLSDPKGDALVVVEGGDLAKSSALHRVFEGADNAVAIPCYLDSQDGLSDVVHDTLKAEGLAIAPDALENAVSRLGSDRGVTRRELEKLALYARGKKQVALEDVRAIMGDEAEVRIEEACDAAGTGDLNRLDLALERLWTADVSAVAVLRQAMAHFQRLLLVGAAREGVDEAMKKLRPPLHFSRSASFKSQAQKWNEARLFEVLDLLLESEALCKTTGVPAEAACARALFNVAAMARMR